MDTEKMYEYIGDKQDPRTTSVKLSADEMVLYLDRCFYDREAPSYRRSADPETALAYLEALKKLGYDPKAVAVLTKYFKALMAAEVIRNDASRALGTLQDKRYQMGDKARENSPSRAY